MAAADALQIRAIERAEAIGIAQALARFEARAEPGDGEWTVVVPTVVSGAVTTGLLDALKTCLESSDIASVKVTMGERTYFMEGAP